MPDLIVIEYDDRHKVEWRRCASRCPSAGAAAAQHDTDAVDAVGGTRRQIEPAVGRMHQGCLVALAAIAAELRRRQPLDILARDVAATHANAGCISGAAQAGMVDLGPEAPTA